MLTTENEYDIIILLLREKENKISRIIERVLTFWINNDIMRYRLGVEINLHIKYLKLWYIRVISV